MERVPATIMAHAGGMAAFGEDLRRAREERGVAVETICDATKVPAKHIRALEAGDLRDLPGGVFRRGFVRSYLAVLGLEERPWMERFEDSCRAGGVLDPAEMEWVTFAENVKNSRVTPRRRPVIRNLGLVILLAALAVAGWCGWKIASRHHFHRKPLMWIRLSSDFRQ